MYDHTYSHSLGRRQQHRNRNFRVPVAPPVAIVPCLPGASVTTVIVAHFLADVGETRERDTMAFRALGTKTPSFFRERQKNQQLAINSTQALFVALFSFAFGCILTGTLVANVKVTRTALPLSPNNLATLPHRTLERQSALSPSSKCLTNGSNTPLLANLRILVVIVAFDFSQQPHLEEVLESYHSLACTSGVERLDVIIHATVAWPVTLIDLLNARLLFSSEEWCEDRFSITISLQPASLRLFLVDKHRAVFYDKLDEYDIFIYSEDDIQVTPTTVATYWYETQKVIQLVGIENAVRYNIGVVRYEYNYPANIIIDDNTRHATQNVTRVYWEHSSFPRPVLGNILHDLTDPKSQKHYRNNTSTNPVLHHRYITMQNHHQGMFLATRPLLMAWRDHCQFDTAPPRPARKGQPTEGTQRVWMSSQMLYGGRHCGVQQLLPKVGFDALTVWHLPNKNYRRVGKYRNRQFDDGTTTFVEPHASLLTAMELHLALAQAWPGSGDVPYRGIVMTDEAVHKARDRTPLLERRMLEYQAYVQRGGVLSEEDRSKTGQVLMEDS